MNEIMPWAEKVKVWELSDAGRKEAFPNEHNDCTVRAYAIAFDIPYYQAHKELADFGRKNGRGIVLHKFLASKGITVTAHKGTVKRFLKEHLEGVFIVRIRHHVFAVKTGKVFDTVFDYERARVTWFLKVK
jgi:hypothetical protein